jgi:putative phosphonate metabolism protein
MKLPLHSGANRVTAKPVPDPASNRYESCSRNEARRSRNLRHAIYFVPSVDDALWAFGNAWLGRNPETGAELPVPADAVAPIAEPRRYGFHATLKPPFALADGATEAVLAAALDAFARDRQPFVAPGLVVARIGRFVALVPGGSAPALHALADDCVRVFDRFRAPATREETARRLRADLSPRQRALLERWGYPYVFEEYRFHMTLTGPLDDPTTAEFEERLRALAAPALAPTLAVREIAHFVEPEPGADFRLRRRYRLGSPAAP